MVVCTMQNYPRDEQLKLVQATQVQTTAGIVDNGNGAEEDEDREEGEIVDEFEMIISSEDEEFKLRARIQQLEDKSKDIEKMDMLAANLANQYSYQRPPGLERYTGPKYQHFSPISILSDVSSLSEEELKFEPPKKTRKHRTKRTESKRHNPSANIRRNPYASHQHMTRSRKKRRHENHHHHCNINNNNHQSSILLNALDSVTDDEICEYDMNVENENDDYAERLKLSRNKLRMALARSGNYDIKPKHSLRERLQCRMPKTSPSPDRKLIRADAELPANSFDGYGNLERKEREDQEQDPDADLEEPEIRLRLIALKSAMLKKHMARKKRDAERAYSPTDMINRVHPPKISDDIDDFMEISPAASPERPPAHSPPPPPPPEPVDMDLAQTDSEEDNAKKEWSQPFNSLANSGGSWRCFMPNPLLPPVSMPISIVIDDDDTEEEELQQQQQLQLQQNNIDDEDELPPPAPSYHIPQLDDDDARDALSLLHTEQQHNQDTLSDIQSISMDNSQTQTQTSRPFHNESSDDEAAALRALLLAGLKPAATAAPSAVAKPLPSALSTVKEEETIGHDSDDPEELRQLLLTSIASKKKPGDELPADSPVILLNAVRRFKASSFEQDQMLPPLPEDSAQSLLNVPLPYLEPQPVPAPVFELVPEPVPAPVPAPIAALVSAPVFELVPEPVPAPVPAPIAALVPEPVPAPVPEPVPAPVCEPAPVPAPEPVPAPIVEPLPVPAPEPAALATLSLPLRVPSPQEAVEAPKSSSSSSIIKIVKPNKVINKKRKIAKLTESEPVIKRPATLLVKEPVAPLHHGQNGTGFSSSTRLITALDPSSIKANKLIIALAAESSAGSDDDLSESYYYNNFTSYAENASPFSPLVDSASNSTTRSNTPNSEVVEPSNPNLRRTIMNEYFEKKLDDYLKNARSLVPTMQLTESLASEAKQELEVEKASSDPQLPKPKADKAAATSPKAKATPVAVRHLPVASQREYLRLIERMQLLEKKKIGANKSTTKTTTAAVRSTTTTTATVVGAGAVKEATTTVAAAVKATTKTAAAAVKETKKATTTVAAAGKEATKNVAAVKATTTFAAVKETVKATTTTVAAAVKETKTATTTTVAAAVKDAKKATTTTIAVVKETTKATTNVAAPEKLSTTATTAINKASPSKKVLATAKKQVLKKVTLRAGTQVNNKPDANTSELPSTSTAAATSAAAAATSAAATTSATQPTKESRLKAFESSFHKIGCSMISNLDKSLQLVDEARKSKITRLRHAHRLKELYAEMQTIKQAVQLEEKKLKRIQPEIQTSHEIIISLKQKRNKLRKAALDLGNGLKGDDYRYYNNKNNNKNNKRQEQQMDKQRSILQIHDSWDRQQMCLTKGRVGNFTQPLQYYTTVEFICRLLDPGKTEITRKYTQLTKDIRLYNSIVKYEHIPEEVPPETVAEQKQDCDSQQPEQSSSNCDSQASASPAENEILKTECDKPEAEVRQEEEAKTTLEFVDTQPEIVPPPPFMRELTELPATQSPLEAYRTPMSRNYNSQLNVNATICPFELMGRCEDTDCSYLHLPRPSPPTTRSKQ